MPDNKNTTPPRWQRLFHALALTGVLAEVAEEISRAQEKHGSQVDVPFGTGSTATYLSALDEHSGIYLDCQVNSDTEKAAKALTDATPTRFNILAEEVFEAGAANDWPSLRAELVQVAAMAAAWIVVGDTRE